MTSREVVNNLDREFAGLIDGLKELVTSVPPHLLYKTPPAVSIGENILRSAAAVEQTCGGLTANLWDDPFEWTLPETLSSPNLILDYLSEVDHARQLAFKAILDDSALTQYISIPSGESRSLVSVLFETLEAARDYRVKAEAAIKILSGEGTPGFII